MTWAMYPHMEHCIITSLIFPDFVIELTWRIDPLALSEGGIHGLISDESVHVSERDRIPNI